MDINNQRMGYPINIPNNINLGVLLEAYPLSEVPNAKDYIIYILGLIRNQKRTRNSYGGEIERYFTPIDSKSLQLFIKSYSVLLNWLVDRGILDVDDNYQIKIRPKGYRFTNDYCTALKQEFILKKAFAKKLFERDMKRTLETKKINESIAKSYRENISLPYPFEFSPMWVPSIFIAGILNLKPRKMIEGLRSLGLISENRNIHIENDHPHNLLYYKLVLRNNRFVHVLMIDYHAIRDIEKLVEQNPELFPKKEIVISKSPNI